MAFGAEKEAFAADFDVAITLRAILFVPGRNSFLRIATVLLRNRPGPRQRTVYRCHFVVQHIGVAWFCLDALLDDALVVGVQRHAAGIEGARAAEAAGLDLKRVVAAVAIAIDPLADGIARKRRRDLRRPVATVGEDPARVVDVLE